MAKKKAAAKTSKPSRSSARRTEKSEPVESPTLFATDDGEQVPPAAAVEPPEDPIAAIGEAAGAVWRHLCENGRAPLAKLPQQTALSRDLCLQAVGWLARENKLRFLEEGRTRQVELL